MYMALYRSFRPEVFDDILGQEHIVKILKNQITTGTTSHAYLFCGTRGTGKTSTARILAKGVNCTGDVEQKPCGICPECVSIKEGTFMDVLEIDAASNNGVDNIRELRESVKYPPVAGRCKVYIIDEVHMLSTGAFNALLKTLEEPPEGVMFILATTEVQKLPATILSRCLRLDFKRISEAKLKMGMRDICGRLDIKISEGALGLIAANADGSVRDGLSLLDQCISAGEKQITRDHVLELLGTAGEEVFLEMTDYIENQQVAEGLLLLDRILQDGKDVRQFIKDWIAHFRSLLMTKFIKNPEDLLNMSLENVERIREQSSRLDLSFINECILMLSKTALDAKWSTQPRILLELAIVNLASGLGAAVGTVANQKKSMQAQSLPSKGVTKTNSTVKAKIDESRVAKADESPTPTKNAQEAGADTTESRPKDAGTNPIKQMDMSKLWYAVFEDGEALKGSFNLLRNGASLKKVGENTFVVEANNEMLVKYANEHAKELEQLMEKHVGRKLRMECVLCSEKSDEKTEKSIEDLVDNIKEKFNLHVEIQ
ncbi:MAG: DNA polymerase III subunit gamma/tau [Anaerovoracaceae bacterium]|jgi:DNA polymerase-3 subunit gamma/tau